MVKVLSVGGSIVAPNMPDTAFLTQFSLMVREWLASNAANKLILVIGGGSPARIYQYAYRDIVGRDAIESEESDWIGIMATRLNAQLVRAIFADLCGQGVICDPTEVKAFAGRVMVAAGWKPGFSSDNDAVILAERFAAHTVINLSNIERVYTDDPKTNPNAHPLDHISWDEFRSMIGDEWLPGKNVPFDPIASRRAQNAGITVICADGKNIENTRRILNEEDFIGTRIS